MKRFNLLRIEDVSGVSGRGVVCQGVVFDNGTVALAWLTDIPSHEIYPNIEGVKATHGHDGKTEVVWID